MSDVRSVYVCVYRTEVVWWRDERLSVDGRWDQQPASVKEPVAITHPRPT